MAPDRDQGALFAFPYPYHLRRPTPLEAVTGKKRKARSVSETESNGSESETAGDREETTSNIGRQVWQRVRQELTRSEPPLLPPFLQSRRKIHSKEQSISVLTAIMQRCLQEEDFVRAGRAFAILLRTDFNALNLDLRSRGLYGVGAELLLHQDQAVASSSQRPQDLNQRAIGRRSYIGFSEQNFAAAKAYYERLAIDYNFRTASSSLVSSLDFYPIMYGLWISTVQDRYLKTLPPDAVPTTENESMLSATPDLDSALEVQRRRDLAREGAYAIEASLKELMISPPYSESAYLQDLHSMLGQWIRDLGRSPQAADQSAGGSDDPSSPEPVG